MLSVEENICNFEGILTYLSGVLFIFIVNDNFKTRLILVLERACLLGEYMFLCICDNNLQNYKKVKCCFLPLDLFLYVNIYIYRV